MIHYLLIAAIYHGGAKPTFPSLTACQTEAAQVQRLEAGLGFEDRVQCVGDQAEAMADQPAAP